MEVKLFIYLTYLRAYSTVQGTNTKQTSAKEKTKQTYTQKQKTKQINVCN
jgi:hypothetical protein